MSGVVLGFDTSNYRTSVAAVTEEGEALLNLRLLLPVREGERGLRQSDAVFIHLRQMKELTERIRQELDGCPLSAVAASVRPRNHPDSYMPVFQVGETIGRVLAAAEGIPFYATDHQSGHVRAAACGTQLADADAFLALHLSGGTTELLEKRGDTLEMIGGTLDLHAGQLVDRAGVAMGLPFPAGPELEKLALQGHSEGRLGCSMAEGDLRCHFSGAETRVQGWIREGKLPREDIAREIYDLLSRTVFRMLEAGRKKTGLQQALIAGGVAASPLLRELLTARCARVLRGPEPVFGRAEYSGDNAVGVALIGAARLRREKENGG